MKSNSLISIAKNLIYAQDADKNYILFSDGDKAADFYILKECDAAVFEVLTFKQSIKLKDLKECIEEKFSLSGMSLDEYLSIFVKMLKEKGFVAVT